MRTVAVITPPTVGLVTTEEAKRHLRVEGTDDDGYIAALVASVSAHIDGPAGWLGRAVLSQTLELRLEDWGSEDKIALPLPPLKSVTSVMYDDTTGAEQTFAADRYRVTGTGTDAGLISLKSGYCWPSIICQAEAVRIRYVAGYEKIPEPIKHAALLIIGHLFANREAVVQPLGNNPSEIPMGAIALLTPFRIY